MTTHDQYRPIHSHPHPAGSAGRRSPRCACARPRQAPQLDRARSPPSSPSSSRCIFPRTLSPARPAFNSKATFPGSRTPPSFTTSASTASASGSSSSPACSRPSASSPVGTQSRPAAKFSIRFFSSSRPPCSASSSRSTSCSTTASGSSRSCPWPSSSPCTAARMARRPRSNSSCSPSFPSAPLLVAILWLYARTHTFNFADLQYQTASGVLPAGALFWVALAFLFAFAVKVPCLPASRLACRHLQRSARRAGHGRRRQARPLFHAALPRRDSSLPRPAPSRRFSSRSPSSASFTARASLSSSAISGG